VNVWAQTNIKSNHLRVASALLESTVLSVNPGANPMATAQLEFVTVIPLPTVLDSATIAVNDPQLAHGLSVQEIVGKRDCVESQGFCTQHWKVWVQPKKCDLNGQYTATLHGTCHPDSTNCNEPWPAFTEVVFDITSDDYCGISQQVDIEGSMSLAPTKCNDYMRGWINVRSPQGARLKKVRITELSVSPTLINPGFITIYNEHESKSSLGFTQAQNGGNQVEFSFEWRGAWLRCDVVAQADAKVLVEFEATHLLEAGVGQVGQGIIGLRREADAVVMLQQADGDAQDMRMTQTVTILNEDGTEPDITNPVAPIATGARRSGAMATAAGVPSFLVTLLVVAAFVSSYLS